MIIVSLVVGLLLNFIGITPIQGLIYSAILYGLTAPVIILVVLLISNNREIIGNNVNGRWSNIFGWLTIVPMAAAAFSMVYFNLKVDYMAAKTAERQHKYAGIIICGMVSRILCKYLEL